jgi:hypothetical protein
MTNKEYHCWIAGRREETQEIIKVPSSWAARIYITRKYDRPIIEGIAHRVLAGLYSRVIAGP